MKPNLCVATFLLLSSHSWAATADISRLAVVGDSLAAGYLNGSLHEQQQPHGFASLIAAQRESTLELPLIGAPGIPKVLTLVSPGPPPVLGISSGTSAGRTNYLVQPWNLAVPLHSVQDALTTRPDLPINDFTDLVLGLPGLTNGISRSQVEWAEALAPTTIFVWIGSNDALRTALAGSSAALTPVPAFEKSFTELLDRLSATGATLVVANIPDVAAIPYFVPIEQIAAQAGVPLAAIAPILGVSAGDFVGLDNLSLVQSILQDPTTGPLPGSAVLTSTEMAAIRTAVSAYNDIIAARATAKGAALVDIFQLTRSISQRGYVVGGQRLTSRYLGGIFSLDGIHPTYTGHAIIANEFIHALNTKFGAGIPPIVVGRVADEDPLILPGVGQPASPAAVR